MEPIFAQLSLEYFMAGKTLPWNKSNNLVPNPTMDLFMVKADVSKARSYFSL